jgi:hypothetical protein
MQNRFLLSAALLLAIVCATPQFAMASAATTPVSVNLSSAANIYARFNNGVAVTNGGADAGGFAYSAALSGSGVVWSGSAFSLGSADTANAVSSTTIALPKGKYATLKMLATSVDGGHANQSFLVNYTDGTATTATQGISDWVYPQNYSGESTALTMAYRLGPNGTRNGGQVYLYGYAFALNSAKTVQSITLPNNRGVIMLGLNLIPAVGTTVSSSTTTTTAAAPVSVSLAGSSNVYALFKDGTKVTNGGVDTDWYAYSDTLSGQSVAWLGSTFTFGAAGTANAASDTTVALPAGAFGSLKILASAVNGRQQNQSFLVTYTDGSTAAFNQSFSDWALPLDYAGESPVLKMGYRLGPTGAKDVGTFYVYGYSFALNSAKTVKSIKLPGNRDVIVLGMSLVPTSSGSSTGSTTGGTGTSTSSTSTTGTSGTSDRDDRHGYGYEQYGYDRRLEPRRRGRAQHSERYGHDAVSSIAANRGERGIGCRADRVDASGQ